jgi:hypothetical protein
MFLSRLWRWLRPFSGWLQKEVMPLASEAAKYVVEAQLQMPNASGEERRDYVVEKMREEYRGRGLSLSMTALLAAIQFAYRRHSQRRG